MPNPPFAKILVSINNQAPTSGGLLAGFGESVTFSAQSTVGWTSARWEIYDYPPGFSAPAGWSTDASGIIFFQPPNQTTPPPTFTLPSTGTNTWGKWALRLRINGNPLQFNQNGSPNTSFVAQYTDETTVFSIPSPKLGMHGVAFNETIQYDTLRAAVGEIMQALRQIDASSSSGGGFVPPTGSGLVVVVSGALSPAASLGTAAQIPIVNAAGTNFAWQTISGILGLSATGVTSINGVIPWVNGGRLQGDINVTHAAAGAFDSTHQIAYCDTTTGTCQVTFPSAASFGGTIPADWQVAVIDTGGQAATSAISVATNGNAAWNPVTETFVTGTISIGVSGASAVWQWDANKGHWTLFAADFAPSVVSTVGSFTMPAIGSTVVVNVTSTASMTVGWWVYLVAAGWMKITAIAPTSVTLLNPEGFVSNAATGAVIAASSVTISGEMTATDAFDVRRFGATPTDIGPSINSAMTAVANAVGGEVLIPPIVGGKWTWVGGVIANFVSLPASSAYARVSMRGLPGAYIAPGNATPLFLLQAEDLLSGLFSLSDVSVVGHGDGVTVDASDTIFQIAGCETIELARVRFYNCLVTGSTNLGIVSLNGETVIVDQCAWLSCGCTAANSACLILSSVTSGVVRNCEFRDIPGTPISGYAWIVCDDCFTISITDCFADEDQGRYIELQGTSQNTVLRVHGGGCSVINPTASLFTPTSTFRANPGNTAVRYTFDIEDFYAQFDLGRRVFADLTGVALFSMRNVVCIASNSGPGDVGIVCRSNVEKLEIKNYQGASFRPWLDFSAGAPALATIQQLSDPEPLVMPCSLAGAHSWFEVDCGVSFSAVASVTGVGGTFAAVAANHTLVLNINGDTWTTTFAGTENTITAFIAAINAVNSGITFSASNVGGQIKISANVSPPNTVAHMSYGQVLSASSADVLRSLGLTAGEVFTGGVVSALVDQSGAVDTTHNLSAGVGGGPAYTGRNTLVRNRPTVAFTGNQSLVSSTWSAALGQSFWVFCVCRQTVAATAFLFDGLAAGQCSARFSATQNSITLNAGSDAVQVTTGSTTSFTAYLLVFNGVNSSVSENSNTPFSFINPGANGLTGLTLGNSQAGNQAGVEFEMFFVGTGTPTLQQQQQIDAYAAGKDGIALITATVTISPGASSGGTLVLSPSSPRWNFVVADDVVTGPNPWPIGDEWLFTNDLQRSDVDLGSGHPVTFQRPVGATYTFENPQNRALAPATSVQWTVGGGTLRLRNDGSIIRCVN